MEEIPKGSASRNVYGHVKAQCVDHYSNDQQLSQDGRQAVDREPIKTEDNYVDH